MKITQYCQCGCQMELEFGKSSNEGNALLVKRGSSTKRVRMVH